MAHKKTGRSRQLVAAFQTPAGLSIAGKKRLSAESRPGLPERVEYDENIRHAFLSVSWPEMRKF
jgi:hypothetical protein